MKTIIIDGIEYIPANSVKKIEKTNNRKNIHFELYQEDTPKRMTLHEAQKYCKSLGEGWRLPTMNEMFYMHENNLVNNNYHYWSMSEGSTKVEQFFDYLTLYAFTTSYRVQAVRDIK